MTDLQHPHDIKNTYNKDTVIKRQCPRYVRSDHEKVRLRCSIIHMYVNE